MKKMMIALVAALMISAGAMAQNDNNMERKQPTKEQMAQQRTESMVKRYNLNEEQAAKLLELNMKYADMRPMGHRDGNRRQRMHQQGERIQRPDSTMRRDSNGVAPRRNIQDFRKRMEEYDTQLKTILTEEQYTAYKNNREKMMQRGPRRGGNQHMNNNNN